MNLSALVRRIVGVVGVVGLTACASPTVVAAPSGPTCAPALPAAPAAATLALNAVGITDAALSGRVMVQTVNVRRQPASTVEVWVRFFNCTDAPLQVEARTHFMDEAQAPTEPVSGWTRVFLPGRSYGVYHESSTDISAVRAYYVEVREGR